MRVQSGLSLGASRLGVLGGVLAFSACATGFSPSQPEWRRERVLRIVAVPDLPAYIDKHCVIERGLPTDGKFESVVVHFRVGHAFYYQAFMAAPGSNWRVGDTAQFLSRSCEISQVSPGF